MSSGMGCLAAKCATMLALCFPLIVSLALAAPGVSRTCVNYCKATDSGEMLPSLSLECDCAHLEEGSESEESSALTLDDTGVYFVPAEVQAFHGQFRSQPFFISNPAKSLPKTRFNRQYDTSELVNDPIPSQSAHVEIYKRTETISHTTINEDTGKLPLYLDLDIQESNNMDRAAVQRLTSIENFESTEKALVECLDFQVIHYTRQYGFMKEFKEFWKARNLNKYEHWPDLHIEENIKKWCSEPESIVKQSLQKIKQEVPKKASDSSHVHVIEDTVNENEDRNKVNTTFLVEFTMPESTTQSIRLFENEDVTEPPEMCNKSTTIENVSSNTSAVYDTTQYPTENSHNINTTESTTSNNEINDNRNGIQYLTNPTHAVTENTLITTENTLIPADSDQTMSASQSLEGITARDIEHDLDTMASEDIFHTYFPVATETSVFYDAHSLINNAPLANTSTTPLSTELSLDRDPYVNVSGSQINDNSTLSSNSPNKAVTDANSERIAFIENEIKIPKIITKECHNNIIITEIDGTEELPNSDFRDSTAETDDFYSDQDKQITELTGKLYFVSNKQSVPMRFVQTKAGNISLGIDGTALCEKIVRNTKTKSSLLAILCDYVHSQKHDGKHL